MMIYTALHTVKICSLFKCKSWSKHQQISNNTSDWPIIQIIYNTFWNCPSYVQLISNIFKLGMYKYPTTKRTHSWDNTKNEHKLLFALAIGELLSVQMKNTADAKP